MNFKDHFSQISKDYAAYRPCYPEDLFDFLVSNCNQNRIAWDCGTGNGQCARGLAKRFDLVIATDASFSQIRQAASHPGISFVVSAAENCAIGSRTVDLATVAQALHWFEFDDYYREVFRVLKPDGIMAAWCYGLCSVSPEIDELVVEFYTGIIAPYWHPERRFVDDRYSSIPFPFVERSAPEFSIEVNWTLDRFLGYLDTWSASRAYQDANQKSPVENIREKMLEAWGADRDTRRISWPVYLRIGSLDTKVLEP